MERGVPSSPVNDSCQKCLRRKDFEKVIASHVYFSYFCEIQIGRGAGPLGLHKRGDPSLPLRSGRGWGGGQQRQPRLPPL